MCVCVCVCVCVCTHLWQELAHKITVAKKSQAVLSANWKSRKASGTIQFEFTGLRIRRPRV